MEFFSAAFKLSTATALIGWIAILGFPLWPRQTAPVALGLSVFLLCAIYCYLVFAGRQHDEPNSRLSGNFFSLAGVLSLFKSPRIVLAGWVHFLAFDLMVGLYVVSDAARHGINHWLMLPVLLLTMMFGPAGLLLYLLVRMAMTGNGLLMQAA